MRAGFVPVGPVRAHVRALQAEGIGYRRIAEVAGVSSRAVLVIITGKHSGSQVPQQSVREDVAERLLAVRPSRALVTPMRRIDATGTRRRLQALVALGWSRAELAARARMNPASVGNLLEADLCTLGTARTVHGLYEELWDQDPPASNRPERRAKTMAIADARRRGWVLPMAWDDESIDDPDARPVRELRVRVSARDRLDELVWLVEAGVSLEQAARRAGYGEAGTAREMARRTGHHALGLFEAGVAA